MKSHLKMSDHFIRPHRICALFVSVSIYLLLHAFEVEQRRQPARERRGPGGAQGEPAVVNISTAYETRSRPNPFSGFAARFSMSSS
jgi:hypothetical protein